MADEWLNRRQWHTEGVDITFFDREPRDRVTVSGADARSYLHSQLSQDVQSMTPGDARWTFVLQPNGRVEALARVTCVSDEHFVLDTETGFGAVVRDRLQRFKIRVAAELHLEHAAEVSTDDVQRELQRITAGWPRMGSEIRPGETIPAETGVVDLAVSFTKGCYPGQELVERMDSRGASAPRQLRHVVVPSGTAVGDQVRNEAGEPIGVVTSVVGTEALALLQRGR